MSCPKNVSIPSLTVIIMKKIENKEVFRAVGNDYVNYSKIGGNTHASDCITSGKCVGECSWHIDILEIMKDVKKTFEVPLYGFTNE